MKMNKELLYYLAHPYVSDPLLNTLKANRLAARLISKGYYIYSPLSMTHYIDVELKYMKIEMPNAEWVDYDMKMLSKCDAIIMSGDWRNSKGCLREKEYMKKNNKPAFGYYAFGD